MDAPQIYRTSKGWRLFLTLTMPPMAALFAWAAFLPWMDHREDETGFVVFCIALGLGGVCFFLYALISAYRERLEIHSDRVRSVGLFRTRELLFSEIEGYRVLPTPYVASFDLVPKSPGQRKIHLALVHENKHELLQWAAANFPNLDELRGRQELRDILSDYSVGSTEEARRKVIESAQKWTRALNALSIPASAWALVHPEPYKAAMITLLALPLAAVALQRAFPGVVKFDEKPGDKAPSIAIAFLAPSLILAFRALQDWTVLRWDVFWLPFSLVTAVLFLLLQAASRDLRQNRLASILALIFCAVYGYGSVTTVNSVFDVSEPALHKAAVLGKRRTTGKTTSYYLELGPWGPRAEAKEVSVPSRTYREYEEGDEATVVVRGGRLGIPWFYVE